MNRTFGCISKSWEELDRQLLTWPGGQRTSLHAAKTIAAIDADLTELGEGGKHTPHCRWPRSMIMAMVSTHGCSPWPWD